ncbi:hypothetical protein E6O75_ATG07422 [Venturia nashicola]|uniref:PUM-HD domain-containing protein n=1 Tax=Venturia nashicola TaxID=86259 RepID=A0A4Z1NYQ8_9PEZI|nr:hypothetical protein E6O75_ATG07422 [Venturia nashicola]
MSQADSRTEAAWGADPLEYYRGFPSLQPKDTTVFKSSLTTNGTVTWTALRSKSRESGPSGAKVSLTVGFPDVDWNFLQSVYGWTALQWQAWARGEIFVTGDTIQTVTLYTDGILEYAVDGVRTFGGDFYSFRKAPLVLHLDPGRHVIDLRLVRDVRAFGGVSTPTIDAKIEARIVPSDPTISGEKTWVMPNDLEVEGNQAMVSDVVDGRLASPYGTVTVRNTGTDWVEVFAIADTEASNFTISLPSAGGFAKRIAPGQTRPLVFHLGIKGNDTTGIIPEKQVALLYRTSAQNKERRLLFTIKLQTRSIHEPHKVTHLHPGDIVSYAMLRAPAKNAICGAKDGKTSAPILLQFHGAGVDADNNMVAHALDPVSDLCAWVLFPTGVTSWSADDWHNWGFADVQAAINAVPDWIVATGWKGIGVNTEKWLVSGHSNGGQGTWYTLLHHPHKVFAAAPVSGYLSIHTYVPYQFWKPADPRRRAVIEASANSYRHELLASNAKGISIYQQHGSADDNVPAYHSRQMSQLISETRWSSNYSELSGKGHWFENVMTTDGLQNFYRNQLSSSMPAEKDLSDFELVVANPGDTGSKNGIEVLYLVDPGQVGKVQATFDASRSDVLLRTSNILALEIQKLNFTSLRIDGQEMGKSEAGKTGHAVQFYKSKNGGWTNESPEYTLRARHQLGGADAILRSKGHIRIVYHGLETFPIALQISRNLYQYFSADSELVDGQGKQSKEDFPGNTITIATGSKLPPYQLGDFPLQITNDSQVLVRAPGHVSMSKRSNHNDVGAVFLRPSRSEALEQVIWGSTLEDLAWAARLTPFMTGVGQPDFVILSRESRWKGVEGPGFGSGSQIEKSITNGTDLTETQELAPVSGPKAGEEAIGLMGSFGLDGSADRYTEGTKDESFVPNGRGRLETFAEARELFKNDPEKYMGMNPDDARYELGIELTQLMLLVRAEADVFPNPRYKLAEEETKQVRPSFKDDPEKYMGMDPEAAARELGIEVAQLMELVDAEPDVFPNPRCKMLLAKDKKMAQRPNPLLEHLTRTRANKLAVIPRPPPPPFSLHQPAGVESRKAVGCSGSTSLPGFKQGEHTGPSKPQHSHRNKDSRKVMEMPATGSPNPRKPNLQSYVTDASDEESPIIMGMKRDSSGSGMKRGSSGSGKEAGLAKVPTHSHASQLSFKQKQKTAMSGDQKGDHGGNTAMLQMLQDLRTPSSGSGNMKYTDPDSNPVSNTAAYRLSPDDNARAPSRGPYDELAQLQYELAHYKQAIAQKDQALSRKEEELSQMRVTSLTLNHLIPDVPSPNIKTESASYGYNNVAYGGNAPSAYPTHSRDLARPQSARHQPVNGLWTNHEDARSTSDRSDGIPSAFAKTQTIWESNTAAGSGAMNITAMNASMPSLNAWNSPVTSAVSAHYAQPQPAGPASLPAFFDAHSTQAQGASHPGAIGDSRLPRSAAPPLLPSAIPPQGYNTPYGAHHNQHDQGSQYGQQHGHYGAIGSRISPPVGNGHIGHRNYANGFHTPVSRLSPTASEFNFETSSGPWNSMQPQQVFISPTEPINYRKLLERHMNTDWNYVVDKIIYNNDQQASIFLQQKLKLGTQEQKDAIITAITKQSLALMLNRFGNFLIQRCFEHGSEGQVVAIADHMENNVVMLSMDAFGCHVVQKAFDCVSEKNKFNMVHELLDRIQDTVIHRYACHVWQKLFELRWTGPPPMIMDSVNRALKGRWHEVALGETGSLVVQNIFENCTEADKRPCVDEVISRIDEIAKGQFGNWCIQHICEHGNPYDSMAAINAILAKASEYSMDQYASKVIEKLLKIGGDEFLERYLKAVTSRSSATNPRMPLIDICSDQFGNYLIQWILVNANPHLREIVAVEVRRHMVSLRGSKYGSRVAMLCTNPQFTIRPGPPSMPARSNYYGPGPAYPQTQGYDRPAVGSYNGYTNGYNNTGAYRANSHSNYSGSTYPASTFH